MATSSYSDPALQQLRAPGRDAESFASVLRDETVGAFEVTTVIDEQSNRAQRQLAEFCAGSRLDDLALVYLSCHGVLDDRGRLYYATTNTEREWLSVSAIPAQWLNEQLEDCRARRQILVLDCCHSGAFARGAKGDGALALAGRFESRGRVVLTASRGTEYSFEGDNVLGQGVSSRFTMALVEGLRTGAADRDQDGVVTVTELYNYAFDFVRASEVKQTPSLWTYGAEGDLVIAENPYGAVVHPEPLPEDLRTALENPRPGVREGAVAELASLLDDSSRPGLALTAQLSLAEVAERDIPRVAAIARRVLKNTANQPQKETQAQDPRKSADRATRDVEESKRREAEEQAEGEPEDRAQGQPETRVQKEAEDRAQQEAAVRSRPEAEDRAKREAEDRAQRRAQYRTQQEAAARRRREAQDPAKREAEDRTQGQAEGRETESWQRREAEPRENTGARSWTDREASQVAGSGPMDLDHALHILSRTERFLAKAGIQKLRQELVPGERVIDLVVASRESVTGRDGVLVITTKRLLFLKRGKASDDVLLPLTALHEIYMTSGSLLTTCTVCYAAGEAKFLMANGRSSAFVDTLKSWRALAKVTAESSARAKKRAPLD